MTPEALLTRALAAAFATATLLSGCSDDELFHLASLSRGLSIREHASVQISGDEQNLVSEATVVGDLDGDGYDDALVRDQEFRLAGDPMQRGAVHVLYGGPTMAHELRLADLPALVGDQAYGDSFGMRSIAAVGDVDGDGLADVLVGAPNFVGCLMRDDPEALPEDAQHGRAYLVYGRRRRFIGATRLGDVGAELRDPTACTGAGGTVTGVGDLDHDGFADFAVVADESALATDAHFLGLGRAYVFYGGPTRLVGPHALNEADAVLLPPADGYGFGLATSAAGDVDGDGFADLLLSDMPYGGFVNTPAHGIGHAYVVRGGATRLVGEASVTTLASTTITGDVWGIYASGVGDLDGDGADDFALGAVYAEDRQDRTAYHLFYGRPGGLPAQLVTDDADAHLMSAQAGWGMAPLAAGDLDADGRRDLVVGDANLEEGRGGVYVVHGDGTRLQGDVELGLRGDTYQGAVGHVPCRHTSDWDGVENCTVDELVGAWVGLGDLDGDGKIDVLASAPTNDPSAGATRVYVVTEGAL
jgi:hypothetical protein